MAESKPDGNQIDNSIDYNQMVGSLKPNMKSTPRSVVSYEKTYPKQGEKKEVPQLANAKKREKTALEKFKSTFFGSTFHGMVDFVWNDVLVPAAKKTIVDAVNNGSEMLVYGEVRGRSRDRRDGYGQVSYSSFYRNRDNSSPRRQYARPSSSPMVNDIVFETREEATEVLSWMVDYCHDYGAVSLAEFHSLAGITGDFTDNKWGWYDLRGVRVIRVPDGYVLDLPKPERLD